jgi:hypothetical protein
MQPFHFSLRALLAAVALVGAGLSAFLSASPIWANALFTAAFFSLAAALTLVCCGGPARRPFWCGFFVFGTAYFLVTSPLVGDAWRGSLLTTDLIRWGFRFRAVEDAWQQHPDLLVGEAPVAGDGVVVLARGSLSYVNLSTWEPVRQSAHAWFSMVFGWAGGVLAAWAASKRDGPSGM